MEDTVGIEDSETAVMKEIEGSVDCRYCTRLEDIGVAGFEDIPVEDIRPLHNCLAVLFFDPPVDSHRSQTHALGFQHIHLLQPLGYCPFLVRDGQNLRDRIYHYNCFASDLEVECSM